MTDIGNTRGIARACAAGSAVRAVAANVSALLFAPFARLYGFSAAWLGLLTAVGFGAQMCADVLLLFLADRVGARRLACIAAALACAGLLAYGSAPLWSAGGGLYALAAAATAVFAFAGGMLEVVLSNAADSLPPGSGASIGSLHTVYARSQAALCLFLLVWFALFGLEGWNGAVLTLAALPAVAFALLLRAPLRRRAREAPPRAAFRPFYIFALCAVFFGYGAEVVMNQWIAAFVSESLGSVAGGLLGCALFALCLGAGGTLYVRRARTSYPALIAAALAAAAAYVAAALSADLPALFCAAACGLFVGYLTPGVMEAAGAFLPRTGGWMFASLAVAQDAGGAALPALAGALAGEGSLRASFLFLAAAPAAAALALACMAGIRARSLRRGRKGCRTGNFRLGPRFGG